VFFAGTMSTMLAFKFMPGRGFALSGHESLNLAILHHFIHVPASVARQTYRHVDYSPTTITLSAEENWSTLTVATTAPRPSHRAISVAPAASAAPQPSL
ncbi:hypothetical protein ACLOJK_037003, partial [Asimina triloba]